MYECVVILIIGTYVIQQKTVKSLLDNITFIIITVIRIRITAVYFNGTKVIGTILVHYYN